MMRISKIKIGNVNNLILFGSGILLTKFAKEAIKRKITTYVFAVKRHLSEVVYDNATLEDILKKEKIPYFHAKDINKSAKLKALVSGETMGIGLGEAYTFTKRTIDLFNGKLFDFMVIRVPQYRGGAHFTWQILRQAKRGGWSIQVINKEMVPGVHDSGAILKTTGYAIPNNARIPKDYFKISDKEGLKLFIDFLDEINIGKEFVLSKPDEALSLHFPRLHTLRHGFINWYWSVEEIEKFICAFDEPYRGASSFLGKKRVFLKDCRIKRNEGRFNPFMAGLIYRIHKGCAFVATKDGALIVKKVVDEDGVDLIHGLKSGQRFHTPLRYLDDAMLYNAEYNTEGLVKEK